MEISPKIIKTLIDEFVGSEGYRDMLAGERYFKIKNDILCRKLNQYSFYNQDTKQVEKKINQNKSDEHLPHSFYKKQVNQKKTYIASKPITIVYNTPTDGNKKTESQKREEKKITNLIWNKLGYNFEELIKNRIVDASNSGRAWLHPNYRDGKLVFEKYASKECRPIYDNETESYLVGMIHFYTIEDLEENKDKIYVEFWNENEVRYYIEERQNDGSESIFVEDVTRPRSGCHFTREVYDSVLNNLVKVEKHSWGKVPFIEIKNNEERETDLKPIKNLIDAYDLIDSNYVNTIEDLKEIIWLINGYGAEDLLALIENLKVNGVARTNDTNGSIDAKLLQIPYEAREALLKRLKELIYEFGRAVDTTNKDLIGQAPSGVSLEFLYSDLDMKADDIITSLRASIYEVLWYVLYDLKMENQVNANINEFDFKIEFNKSRIFNEIEKVQALSNDQTLSTKTKLEKHPWVDDPDIEMQRIKEEKEENIKRQQTLFESNGPFGKQENEE